MSYEPLHHKYRPQTFKDLVGQSAIAKTLINAIKQEKIAPAYLFTGPRGTGKTSSARILAKSLNCLKAEKPTPNPCGECEVCKAIAVGTALDVIEIDAASNTGVDNIREIIERSRFAPVQSRYKVYAIDECLTGDSLVQTSTGLMRIDAPKLKGKLVLSYNENTQAWEYKKVLRWLERGKKETIAIKTQNYLLHCTKNHLIYTDQGWIKAGKVKEGMKILSPLQGTENREQGIVTTNLEKVEFVCQGDYKKVYDLEVEDNHNFVANGLLVHNCHMLSTAAFNALLKTLEEPPPRVVFILATTDPQRVLPTIISRCQRFDYRRIPLEEMVSHLEYIAQQEEIDIELEAIKLVAQVANGGLRDAESLLDQLSLFPETITVDQVWDLVGAIPERDLLHLLQQIRTKNFVGVLSQCRNLLDRGREPITVLQNLAGFYLNLLIAKSAPYSSNLVAVTEDCWEKLQREAFLWQQETILWGQQKLKEAETQIKNTTQPRLWLEVTLLGLLSEPIVTVSNPENSLVKKSFTETVSTENDLSPKVQPVVEDKQTATEDKTENIVSFPPTQNQSQPTKIARKHPQSEEKVVPITKNQSVTDNSNTVSSVSEADIQAIWQKALTILQPPTTRSLLNQKCHLIALEDSMAIIGISSPPLLRLLQGKVKNIETAFTQVCQRKIKITLEIASHQEGRDTEDTENKNQGHIQSDNPLKPINYLNSPLTDADQGKELIYTPTAPETRVSQIKVNTPVDTPSINTQQESFTTVLNENNTDPEITSNRLTQASTINTEVSHQQQNVLDSISSETEFNKAVELIAKNFEGEIITLDNSTDNIESEDLVGATREIKEDITSATNIDYDTYSSDKEDTSTSKKIANRPDSSQYDEEDVPFAKPINLAVREFELQDCWELAINQPGKWLYGRKHLFD